MPQSVQFQVPLPPPALRANSRAFWAKKKKEADIYSQDVNFAYIRSTVGARDRDQGFPWKSARVQYEWRYAGVEPDHSNLGGHTKYLQDIMCVAPKLSPKQSERYKRWHLGLVENDRGISATFTAVKVAHRVDECVVVTVVEAR